MEVRPHTVTNPDSILNWAKAKENQGQATSAPAVEENVHSGGVVFLSYSVDFWLDVRSASARYVRMVR
jgi:hypothetical protein